MSDPVGVAYANQGLPSNFFGDIPRTTYASAGADISASDRVSLVSSADAVTMSLASGVRDGQPLIIKNIGAGTLTLTATIDGTAGTMAVNSLDALRLLWSAALGTWLSV